MSLVKYVALLRGINVGGNNKVEMPRLKRVVEELGCGNVITYINSGNVVFTDDRSTHELAQLATKSIKHEFGLEVPVVVRDQQNIAELCKKIPLNWTNDDQLRTDVMFLWQEIDSEDILDKIKINPEIENAIYFEGALVWNIGRQNVTRGAAIKLINTDVYKHMTIRNINTVRKLNDLMTQ